MAFNTSDTRQRAYNPIDTSNPVGTWVEEKAYNKTRPGDCKKVLCGNWQEERVLEGDMLSQGLDVSCVRLDGTKFRGGFESSPYLTLAVDPKERRPDMLTTQRGSFNERNGDVKSQQQPALGVRAAARADQVLEQAKEALSASQGKRNAASLEGSFVKGASLRSTYSDSHGGGGSSSSNGAASQKRVITEIRQDYLADTPITLYTGNPSTGKTMVVHGKTPQCPSASSVHARHTGFSNEKYTIGSL